MSDTAAHEEIQKLFHGLIKRGQLHHAYALVGAESTDKKTFALSLAADILQTTPEKILLHPDFLLIEQELNEKTGKTKRDIDIDQIKRVQEFSTGRPMQAQKKVVIVDQAEKMNDHSSNALLKTLEEPKGQTVFLLLTHDETQLLPTIRSRVQLIFLSSQVATEYDTEFVQLYINLFDQPLYQKMKSVDHLFGDKTDHIAARENLVRVLESWEVLNRDYLLKNIGQETKSIHAIALKKKYPVERFLKIHSKIIEAKKFLLQNVHPKLVVEQILLEIP